MKSSCTPRGALAAAVALVGLAAAAGQERVFDTMHNLSIGGPGTLRAQSEQQVCIFCHAPHHASGVRPLWNHEFSVSSYAIYESSTLNAQPGQPTGASKLCLSCHDGTIALGSVLSRSDHIRMVGGDFLPAGLTNLGTDLSDDHPVSFAYTPGLAMTDGQLANPVALPPDIRLDSASQLQCTSCHDAHRNVHGAFLTRSNEYGALCTACHQMRGWTTCSHTNSNASVANVPDVTWPYDTVAQNACRSCHRPHTAGGHARLLIFDAEERNCLDCHDGRVAHYNIQSEIDKSAAHDPRSYQSVHDPAEPAAITQHHVECADCHNPHAAAAPSMQPGYIPLGATLQKLRGISYAGAPQDEAHNEYEVCFRCHGDTAVPVSGRISRLFDVPNLRLRFSPSNASYHPVVTAVTQLDTVSLIPGLPHGSLLRCTDCHNNDQTRRTGGSGPDGPHGSVNAFLLERNYTVTDNLAESEFEYALCYRCHLRSSILGNQSFSEHRKHIVEERAPCSACHDPHGVSLVGGGSSDRTHLINFDVRIVRPDPQTGLLNFRDLGRFRGSCTLICHGETHRDEAYPEH
jgi:predicted CXXCH cytochrome family protein